MPAQSIPAFGVRGFILKTGPSQFSFRVYNPDGTFTDYDLRHHDLEVEIICQDAVLEEHPNGRNVLDYTRQIRGKDHEST